MQIFPTPILKNAKFISTEAGLQGYWAIVTVIILLFLSIVLGFFPAIASSSVISLFLPLNLQEFDLIPAVLVLIVLTVFFITTIRQGLGVGIGAGIAAVAGTMAVSAALAWAGAKSGVLAVAVAGTGALAGAIVGTGLVAITVAVARAVALRWSVFVALTEIIMTGVWSAISSRVEVTWAGKVVAAVGWGWAVMAMIVAETITGLGIYLAWRALLRDEKQAFIHEIAISLAAIKGTSFRNADLTDADFIGATLKNTDFRKAILTRTYWHNVKNLNLARLGTTYLQNAKLQQLLTDKIQDINFDRQDLRGVNLQGFELAGASFVDADLSQANLQEVKLFEAKLVRTNLDQANLSNADILPDRISKTGVLLGN
ncbi:MAG: pentapeptide repeat-containing protein [Hydrococcus sp. CSU_1_8]|nr:pentapeptide repeat-containing protein [Hydrococcus sp. CSU_1_8]